MTPADHVIQALRTGHDGLAQFVATLSDDDLTHASGASEWDVSGVLSHLGSGTVIGRATLEAALAGTPNPGRDFNQSVWNEWNARSPRQRADRFVVASGELVAAYEALDDDQRENLRIDMGFLPAPVDVATAGRMRLNEQALHSWDARVAFEDNAVVTPEAAEILLPASGDLMGFIAKTDELGGRRAHIAVTTTEPSATFVLHLADRVSLDFEAPDAAAQGASTAHAAPATADADADADADGTLALPAEAWLRLSTGRLAPKYTPATVSTTGSADLDLLRRVFQGY